MRSALDELLLMLMLLLLQTLVFDGVHHDQGEKWLKGSEVMRGLAECFFSSLEG